MDETRLETVEYYIVFTKSNHRAWYMRFLDPYFQHCYAIKKSPGGSFWIKIDPKRGFTKLDLLIRQQGDGIRKIVKRSDVVLRVLATINPKTRYRIWHVNCVEVVKTLIGLDKWCIITPKQLYNEIRRNYEQGY